MRTTGALTSAIQWDPQAPLTIKSIKLPLAIPDVPADIWIPRPQLLSDALFGKWAFPAVKAAMIGVSIGLSPLSPGIPARAETVNVGSTEEEIAADTVQSLRASPGLLAMAPELQNRLLRWVGGSNHEVSMTAVRALRTVIKSEAFLAMDAGAQRVALEEFLRDQPRQVHIASTAVRALTTRAAYTVSDATPVDRVTFRSGDATGLRYTVTVNGQAIPVFFPTADVPVSLLPGLTAFLPTIDQVAQALAGLPDYNRRLITSIYINPGRNPSDEHFATQFGRRGFISYMTADGSGLVSIYPALSPTFQRSLDFSLLHETGHVLSQQLWGAHYTDARWDPWKAAAASDGITPTSYARESIGEDFAETLVFYIATKNDPLAHAELRAMFPARFAILDGLNL